MPKATAVVVTYRSRKTIPDSMELARAGHEAGLLDCVVVDNDSGDGTVDYLRSEHPWTKVLSAPGNLGYGRASNLAFQHVETPYVLLLNPDAALSPEALATLLGFMEQHPDAGIAAPAIREPDGTFGSVGCLPTPWNILAKASGLRHVQAKRRSVVPGTPPFRTDWVSGAVQLVRKEMLDELHGFDPRFFLYFEDNDLCRRALERGWSVWAVGTAVAEHLHGASAAATGEFLYERCIAEHYFRSRFYYLVKHHGWAGAVIADLGELLLLGMTDAARILAQRDRRGFAVRLRSPMLRRPRPISDLEGTNERRLSAIS